MFEQVYLCQNLSRHLQHELCQSVEAQPNQGLGPFQQIYDTDESLGDGVASLIHFEERTLDRLVLV